MFEKGERHRGARALPGAAGEGTSVRGPRARWFALGLCVIATFASSIVACGQKTDVGSGSPDERAISSSILAAMSSAATGGGSSGTASSGASSSSAESAGSSAGDGGGTADAGTPADAAPADAGHAADAGSG